MPNSLLLTVLAVVGIGVAASLLLAGPRASAKRRSASDACAMVGVGTVQTIDDVVTVEVQSVTGQTFTGRLRDDAVTSALRPGAVLLVAFDPFVREELSLADDMLAVRAAFDRMLVDKGLLTQRQLDLIRHGTRSRGVVTAMHPTGASREDYREVALDLMVRRPEGGQFPAHETALIPASSLGKVAPGSTVDAYYRPGDESSIAVCVTPS